jgi:hypothetical protein
MFPVIAKTFGGLPTSCYVRHFLFGLLFPVFICITTNGGKYPLSFPILLMFSVNTLLYPYSRFVYESVVDFIIGRNVFLVNVILMLAFKVATMMLCWGLAIFIAPIGLVYLYFYHSKAER